MCLYTNQSGARGTTAGLHTEYHNGLIWPSTVKKTERTDWQEKKKQVQLKKGKRVQTAAVK
uniref:Uncharacterized protein n=1 Tax=Anguilla anguilla TaxID=7936 RepID=A0A0E9SY21_ANGAN